MLDFILACGHHLAAFLLFGALFAQLLTLRGAVDAGTVRRLAAVDLVYGVSAALVIAFGIARVAFAAKGWAFYESNGAFWAKMALFLLVGLMSIPPTIAFRRWRNGQSLPSEADVLGVRRFVHAQLALFALIPIAAAAMARGYGQL